MKNKKRLKNKVTKPNITPLSDDLIDVTYFYRDQETFRASLDDA